MKTQRYILGLALLAGTLATTACIKEDVNSMDTSVPTEGLLTLSMADDGSKMAVNGRNTQFTTDDRITINGVTGTLRLQNGTNYFSRPVERPSTGNYYIGYVGNCSTTFSDYSLSSNLALSMTIPSSYQYEETAWGSGKQKITDLPMVAVANSNASNIKFHHVTSSLNVTVTNDFDKDIVVDSIVVFCPGRSLNGTRTVTVRSSMAGSGSPDVSASSLQPTAAEKRVSLRVIRNMVAGTSKSFVIPIAHLYTGIDYTFNLNVKVYGKVYRPRKLSRYTVPRDLMNTYGVHGTKRSDVYYGEVSYYGFGRSEGEYYSFSAESVQIPIVYDRTVTLNANESRLKAGKQLAVPVKMTSTSNDSHAQYLKHNDHFFTVNWAGKKVYFCDNNIIAFTHDGFRCEYRHSYKDQNWLWSDYHWDVCWHPLIDHWERIWPGKEYFFASDVSQYLYQYDYRVSNSTVTSYSNESFYETYERLHTYGGIDYSVLRKHRVTFKGKVAFSYLFDGNNLHSSVKNCLLTAAEWQYVIYNRPNAAQKRGKATVGGKDGVILLPDFWTCPAGYTFNPNGNNTYTQTQFEVLAAAGAVFLHSVELYNGSGGFTPNTKQFLYQTSTGAPIGISNLYNSSSMVNYNQTTPAAVRTIVVRNE